MKAMILAAGRGQRMLPLTQNQPKPMLDVNGKPLITYHLRALAKAGVKDVVINLSYLVDQVQDYLGDGKDYGVKIHYSVEAEPLETGGGIFKALPHFQNEPFIVINGDVWTDYPLETLKNKLNGHKAHLVLVDNPEHHINGDFYLQSNFIVPQGDTRLTYAGLGVYHPDLFANARTEKFPLLSVLRPAIEEHQVSGEHYQGLWLDVGTPERLQLLNSKQFSINA